MRILIGVLILAALAVIAVANTNVTGKWTGRFHSTGPDGEPRESTAVMLLKQNGSDVTGTVGPNESDQDLADNQLNKRPTLNAPYASIENVWNGTTPSNFCSPYNAKRRYSVLS